MDPTPLIVLGIETSCDETAVALYDGEKLLAHTLHSQARMHAEYGGVVPELAARDHIKRLIPLTRTAARQAGIALDQIGAVAYTAGPGLIGALLTGASFAAGVATALNVPLIPVHHLEAHLLAPMLENPAPKFPFVALLVSGGHTMLVAVYGVGSYQLLGESLDDAAGEAFDKSAKRLDLPYPGGPALAQLATQGNSGRFRFSRPMTDRPGLDFSFSGLKTAFSLAVPASPDDQTRADLALAFEEAVTDTLAIKCGRALDQSGLKQLVVAGGVGANKRLRERLAKEAQNRGAGLFFPRIEFCTDNAAMVAYAGWQRQHDAIRQGTPVRARWPMTELDAPSRRADWVASST